MHANTLKLYVALLQHHLSCSPSVWSISPFHIHRIEYFMWSTSSRIARHFVRDDFFFYNFRWCYITRPNYCSRILLAVAVVVVVIVTRSNKMKDGQRGKNHEIKRKGEREREKISRCGINAKCLAHRVVGPVVKIPSKRFKLILRDI